MPNLKAQQPPRTPAFSPALQRLPRFMSTLLLMAGLVAILYSACSCRQTTQTEPEPKPPADESVQPDSGNADDGDNAAGEQDGGEADATGEQDGGEADAADSRTQDEGLSNSGTEASTAQAASPQSESAASSSASSSSGKGQDEAAATNKATKSEKNAQANQSGGGSPDGGPEAGEGGQDQGKTPIRGAATLPGDASSSSSAQAEAGHSAGNQASGQLPAHETGTGLIDALEQDIAGIYRSHNSLLLKGDINVYQRIAANYMTTAKTLYALANRFGHADYNASATAEWNNFLKASGDAYSWNKISFFSSLASLALLESLPHLAHNKISPHRIQAIRTSLDPSQSPGQEILLNNARATLEMLVCLAESRGMRDNPALHQAKNALSVKDQPVIRHTEQLTSASSSLLISLMQNINADAAAQACGIANSYSAKTHAASDSFHRLEAQSEGFMQILRLALPNLARSGY